MSSLKRFDGWMMTDHRAGPGVPELGLPHGQLVEHATISCWHCRVCVVVNPLRTRERSYCRLCDRYICDICAAAAKEADYVHSSFDEVADKVRSGKYTLAGSIHKPVLIPVPSSLR